jgi:anti-sigma-K factor RskA
MATIPKNLYLPFSLMFSRIINSLTSNAKNETTAKNSNSKFNELERTHEEMDPQSMGHIGGGRNSQSQLQQSNSKHLNMDDLYNISAMPGGGTPS